MSGYTCFYCKFATTDTSEDDWAIMTTHPCLEGGENFMVDENNLVFFEGDEHQIVPDTNNKDFSQAEAGQNLDETILLGEVGNNNEWNSAAVLLLIEKYEANREVLEKKNTMKKHIWNKIVDEMNEFGYTFTWDQLQNKWKSLIRTYKSVKDNNNETGRNRKNWPFFNAMDNLLAKNPTIEPPVAVHNGNRIKRPVPTSSSSTSSQQDSEVKGPAPRNASDSSNTPQASTSSKRKRDSTDIADILTLAIEQNQRHHEEDIREKEKFNELLEAILKNINNN